MYIFLGKNSIKKKISTAKIMYYRIEVTPLAPDYDSRAKSLLRKINQFVDVSVDAVQSRDVYSIFAEISKKEVKKIVEEIKNPIIYKGNIGQVVASDLPQSVADLK